MMPDLPPDWAIERALELGFTGTKLDDLKRHWPGHTAHIAFAAYIAAHEEAPVDPLLIEARKLFNEWNRWDDQARARVIEGSYDSHDVLVSILKGLRRGVELTKAGEA